MLLTALVVGLAALCSARSKRGGGDRLVADTAATTTPPGCCRGSNYQTHAMCQVWSTQRGCEIGRDGCEWVETDDPSDCVINAIGCCRGNAICEELADQIHCERKNCEWFETDDPSDCDLASYDGCCKAESRHNPADTYRCSEKDNDLSCENQYCVWVAGGELDVDCAYPETEAPEEPGCCYGNPDIAYSKKWMERCTEFDTEKDCTLPTNSDGNARCVWEVLGEYEDCEMLWPTTTTTTLSPGCCRGSSYKAQNKCIPLEDQVGCERKDCEWVETDDPSECLLTTTTTTEEPGCCKGSSRDANDKCNAIGNGDRCDKRSSCHWIAFGVLLVDCAYPMTEAPEEPGCCYGNPDIAYSIRWAGSCPEFDTERDCTLLTNSDGHARCVWEALGEYEDCEMLWPTTTTTTTPPGCCRGSNYQTHAMCMVWSTQRGCEIGLDGYRDGCEWVRTHDPSDCVINAVGCCRGSSSRTHAICEELADQIHCERKDCEWFETDDASDCELASYDGCCKAESRDSPADTHRCSEKDNDLSCENQDCVWVAGGELDVDCAYPQEPWKSAKGHGHNPMLFGDVAVITEAMSTQVSLSTMLLVIIAVLAGQQLYRWWSDHRDGSLDKLAVAPQQGSYQAV